MTELKDKIDTHGISVIKTKDGEYRVSCLKHPFDRTRSFRVAAGHYFHRAHANPAAARSKPIYSGLDNSEIVFLESLRQFFFTNHGEYAGGT